MKTLAVALVAILGVALSGCASIIKGDSQSIAITTPPTTGANCILSSKEGSWTVISPGAVTVDKSKDDVQVRCSKPGWQDAASTIPSNFEGWTLGNLLLGGVIGLGVDAATGAINEYAHSFQVPMTPISGYVAPAEYPSANVSNPTAKPSFGITGSTVTSNSTVSVGMPEAFGVWISSVAPSSPAERAGLKQGDVIQTVDDKRISTFDELSGYISKATRGSTMKLGVWRDRKTTVIMVVFPGQI